MFWLLFTTITFLVPLPKQHLAQTDPAKQQHPQHAMMTRTYTIIGTIIERTIRNFIHPRMSGYP
jgi:hypothetical protein